MPLHEAWSRFDREDWFPLLARFVITTDRYFVFPRVSQTTGWGDAGTHFLTGQSLLSGAAAARQAGYDFKTLDEADAVYDSFFELQPDRLNRLTDHCAAMTTRSIYMPRNRASICAPSMC